MAEEKAVQDKTTAHDTKLHEAASPQPRGNIHSEEEDGPEQDAPPPLPV